MELHVLQYYRTNKGIYTSIDEVEIRKLLGGGGFTYETIDSNINIAQQELVCYEDNGEFHIQNENGDKVCYLKVFIDELKHDSPYCTIESTESIDIQLSEENYRVFISGKLLSDINLTDSLKRDINNTIKWFIARINTKIFKNNGK